VVVSGTVVVVSGTVVVVSGTVVVVSGTVVVVSGTVVVVSGTVVVVSGTVVVVSGTVVVVSGTVVVVVEVVVVVVVVVVDTFVVTARSLAATSKLAVQSVRLGEVTTNEDRSKLRGDVSAAATVYTAATLKELMYRTAPFDAVAVDVPVNGVPPASPVSVIDTVSGEPNAWLWLKISFPTAVPLVALNVTRT
jgi:hypothetical protein